MTNYVSISDLHLGGSHNVRTGDVYEDIWKKLDFVVNYTNNVNADLLLPGDIFDKPTLPDTYKNKFISILKKVKNTVWVIYGNHDELFNNENLRYKTSLNLLITAGIVKELKTEVFKDHVLTGELPLKTYGMPQVAMFHGFLNVEDGKNTVKFSDLDTKDSVVLVLGHDHTVYEPVKFGNVEIVRPGSFLRGIRLDEQHRIPKLVHISVGDGMIEYNLVDILCRDAAEIFTTKQATISKRDKEESYDDIINQIRNSKQSEMTLMSALGVVTTPDVVLYLKNILEEAYSEKENK